MLARCPEVMMGPDSVSVLKPVGPSSPSAKKVQLFQVGKMPGALCVALGVVTGGAVWPDQDDPAVLGDRGEAELPPTHLPSGICSGHHQPRHPTCPDPSATGPWAASGHCGRALQKEEQPDTAEILQPSQSSKLRERLLGLQETIEWEALKENVYLGGQVD